MSLQEYKSEPCPICGHKGWCGYGEDGLVLCKRPPSPPEVGGYAYRGLAKDSVTAMYVEAGKERRATSGPPPLRRNHNDRPSVTPAALEAMHIAAVAALTPDRLTALAGELGVLESSLVGLAIGWSDTAQHHGDHRITGAYVFPEYDGQGRLVGATYRFPQARVEGRVDSNGEPLGNKSAPAGFRRGLTLPLSWKELSGPILIPEGPSDVLAGVAIEMNVIGRPSNIGGVESIAQLCQRRQVIILGENDRKPDGHWPGKEGAEIVARRLETTWGRPVHVAFPPEGIKDLRDWVRQLAGDWQNANIAAVREAILRAVQSPSILLLALPQDRRGRVTVKAFRWSDGVEAPAIHSDQLVLENAAARKRFAKAVAKIEPTANEDDLVRQLLAIKVPPVNVRKEPASRIQPAGPPTKQQSTTDAAAGSAPETAGIAESKPQVFLPGGPTPITESATALGTLLARTGKHYIRGGVVTTVGKDNDGRPILETIKPAALASVFETVAKPMKYATVRGESFPQEAICTEQDAKLIQNCAAFQELLPPIKLLSRCPVLIERDGKLVRISGYDRDSGILTFGQPAADMSLEEAVALLSDMLADFHFATPADRARALAVPITAALVFGNLLGGRAPADLGEADASQAGKGLRNKLTAAIFGHIVKTITQKKGGVGSMEESFATALIQGYNFISFDNVRNALDSPAVESFLTEDSFLARVPHQAAVEIDPRRVIVQITSNKADITVDMANRSSCVRILKQPDGYRFHRYPEGNILDHVRANQPLYLGAVFAVIKAWHDAGKPRSETTSHDFRPWAPALDWIVQNVFKAGPLLDGHRETQVRMSSPSLNWVRDVALAVRNGGHLGTWLRANDLVEIISESSGTELPGLSEGGDLADEDVKKKVLQAVGRRMAQCFGHDQVRTLDGFKIERKETDDPINRRTTREYCFQVVASSPEPVRLWHQPHGRTIGAPIGAEVAESPVDGADSPESTPMAASQGAPCAYAAPMSAPIVAPIKPLCAPIAPMGSVIAPMETPESRVSENTCEICADSGVVMETHRRIGAIGADSLPSADPIPEPDEVLI